jgi:hypothetical protein
MDRSKQKRSIWRSFITISILFIFILAIYNPPSINENKINARVCKIDSAYLIIEFKPSSVNSVYRKKYSILVQNDFAKKSLFFSCNQVNNGIFHNNKYLQKIKRSSYSSTTLRACIFDSLSTIEYSYLMKTYMPKKNWPYIISKNIYKKEGSKSLFIVFIFSGRVIEYIGNQGVNEWLPADLDTNINMFYVYDTLAYLYPPDLKFLNQKKFYKSKTDTIKLLLENW